MCLLHKWTKWEQYQFDSYKTTDGVKHVVQVERRQRRHCEKCNKEQDEHISTCN